MEIRRKPSVIFGYQVPSTVWAAATCFAMEIALNNKGAGREYNCRCPGQQEKQKPREPKQLPQTPVNIPSSSVH